MTESPWSTLSFLYFFNTQEKDIKQCKPYLYRESKCTCTCILEFQDFPFKKSVELTKCVFGNQKQFISCISERILKTMKIASSSGLHICEICSLCIQNYVICF